MSRLFIAIQFPIEVKQLIQQAVEPLQPNSADRTVRWVDASLYHLTLKFLGDVEDHSIAPICQVTSEVVAVETKFELEVGDFGVFPNFRKPRVLWVGLRDGSGGLRSLKMSLESSFEKLGYDRERRRFHPHVTVGRVRRNAAEQGLNDLTSILNTFSVDLLATVAVDRIYLVQSELTQSGPIYTTLEQFDLKEQE